MFNCESDWTPSPSAAHKANEASLLNPTFVEKYFLAVESVSIRW